MSQRGPASVAVSLALHAFLLLCAVAAGAAPVERCAAAGERCSADVVREAVAEDLAAEAGGHSLALLQLARDARSSRAASAASSGSGRQGSAESSRSRSCGEWLKGGPQISTTGANPDGGNFTVWRFPLAFSNLTIYWRRFGVDVPKDPRVACPPSGCPILVDFPGSGGSVYTQRAWTKWFRYQKRTPWKFILVTMEGSPDGVAPLADVLVGTNTTPIKELVREDVDSYTSWNVLGWGTSTPLPDPEQPCMGDAGCFAQTYNCFGTQLAKNPKACTPDPARPMVTNPLEYPMESNQCVSASAANDWDYVKQVLGFLVDSDECHAGGWCGDRSRIYFTGQSMGGMASIQFATPDVHSPYYMGDTCKGDVRPAAIVACSPGGSRKNDVDLRGEVPALVIQGASDSLAAGTLSGGLYRNKSHGNSNTIKTGSFSKTATVMDLVDQTQPGGLMMQVLQRLQMQADLPNDRKDRVSLLLQADLEQGGALLADHLPDDVSFGCLDNLGNMMAIGRDHYLWEVFNTTVQRVVGLANPLRLSTLTYTTTAGARAAEARFRCADAGQVRVCSFSGGHTYPWVDEHPAVLHEYVWENFLKNGTLLRGSGAVPSLGTS